MAELPSAGEDRYRLLVDSITDYAIYMLDPHGIVSSWNAGAQRFKGYTREEIIGQHFSIFYTPEDRAGDLPGTALAVACTEGRFEREGWRVRKDGARFWAHVVIDPIRSDDGELLGFAKITRDLTERRLAQEALRRTEEQFRVLVQGVTDYAIYMLDVEGRVVSWNAGAQRIKGYSALEIIGEHFERFYTEDDRAAGLPAQSLENARREGRFEKEGWRVRRDGTPFRAHVVIDALKNDDGELIGFAKVTRDVTERYKAQQELQRTQQALAQSQKMEALGQITGGVAHDFNNLLMAVLSALELARKRVQDPKVLGLINNAIKGAARGSELTARMLAFARKQALQLKPLDVAASVHGMFGLLQRAIGPTVTIETRFLAGLPMVPGDQAQLEAALLNLVVNARDAMPDGGTISIGASLAQDHVSQDPTGSDGQPAQWVRLFVQDTGEGMDEETLRKATEPFFTTKEVGKGTGLGLSMVQGFMEQSGGRLRIHSTRGQGTRIELWFPVLTVENAPPPQPQQAPEPVVERTLNVLVVDDDELVITNVAAMLEDMGHHVRQAHSAAEALNLLQGDTPVDLLVTDQAMPKMTGSQLAKRVKELRPSLPIVLASGFSLPGAPDAGIDVRLAKPFNQQQLAGAIARVIR